GQPAAAQVALGGLGIAAEQLGPQPLGVLHLVAVAVAVHLGDRDADLGDQAAALGGLDHRVVAQVADHGDALVAAAHAAILEYRSIRAERSLRTSASATSGHTLFPISRTWSVLLMGRHSNTPLPGSVSNRPRSMM